MDKSYTVGAKSMARIAETVRWSEAQRGRRPGQRTPPRITSELSFVGITWAGGPNGEGDFNDHRYWFRSARIDTGTELEEADYTEIIEPTDQSYRWSSFTNMAEYNTRGHLLRSFNPARISLTFDGDGNPHYTAWLPPVQPFAWAKVTSAQNLATNRWIYTAIEQEELSTGFGNFAGQRTFTGVVNGMEANNSGSGIQGNGIDLSQLPSGFTLAPIRGNPVVQLWPMLIEASGAFVTRWYMQASNALTGACP